MIWIFLNMTSRYSTDFRFYCGDGNDSWFWITYSVAVDKTIYILKSMHKHSDFVFTNIMIVLIKWMKFFASENSLAIWFGLLFLIRMMATNLPVWFLLRENSFCNIFYANERTENHEILKENYFNSTQKLCYLHKL